ncbi:hypothetical protein Ancab_029915 [Ancistrocladus abbreviatus]
MARLLISTSLLDIISKLFPIKVNDHLFIITVVEEFTYRQCALKESSLHKEKGPGGSLDGEWSKNYNRVSGTQNNGDATLNGSNSSDFEDCNDEPKMLVLKGSRGIKKALTVSKSFRDYDNISQGNLNEDGTLNEGGKRMKATRHKRNGTRDFLLNPGTVLRSKIEGISRGKNDNRPLTSPAASNGLDHVLMAPGDKGLKNKLRCLRDKALSSNTRKQSSNIKKPLAKETSFSHSIMSPEAKSSSNVEGGGDSAPIHSSTKPNPKFHSNHEQLQVKEI